MLNESFDRRVQMKLLKENYRENGKIVRKWGWCCARWIKVGKVTWAVVGCLLACWL